MKRVCDSTEHDFDKAFVTDKIEEVEKYEIKGSSVPGLRTKRKYRRLILYCKKCGKVIEKIIDEDIPLI